ncbi:MAG: hypothetical protein ACE367_04935 [Acidimicrobiales bacterium]
MTDTDEPTRQCGRCRALFPVGEDYEAGVMPDWWLCPPCRTALLGRNA